MRVKRKLAVLAVLAVLTLAALIYINLQHARGPGSRTFAVAGADVLSLLGHKPDYANGGRVEASS